VAEPIRLSRIQLLVLMVGVLVTAFLGVVAGSRFVQRERRPDAVALPKTLLEQGELFPDSTFVALDGRRTRLSTLLEGKRSLLVFLSTECGACELLTSRFNQDYPRVGSEFGLVGISFESMSTLVRSQKDMAFPLVCDSLRIFTDRYKIASYPTVIGLDEKKRIAFIDAGYREGRGLGDYLKKL
jgi:peroxiredoxin